MNNGGRLFIVEGLFWIDYRPTDVAIFDGNSPHGVSHMRPRGIQKCGPRKYLRFRISKIQERSTDRKRKENKIAGSLAIRIERNLHMHKSDIMPQRNGLRSSLIGCFDTIIQRILISVRENLQVVAGAVRHSSGTGWPSLNLCSIIHQPTQEEPA
eukprot:scaffold2238_cov145-Skeletonema_menzelii.AAC.5